MKAKVRVLIATTKGPVRVTGLEPTSMSKSAVVANEYTVLPKLSDAYDNFLKFGPLSDKASYRLDPSEPIDGGERLQLTLVLVPPLFPEGRQPPPQPDGPPPFMLSPRKLPPPHPPATMAALCSVHP